MFKVNGNTLFENYCYQLESFINTNEAQINSFLTSYFEPTQLFFYLNLIL